MVFRRYNLTDRDIIRTLVEYHAASNRRLWDHLLAHVTDEQFTEALDYSHGSIRNLVVHMAATDRYWLHDIQVKPVTGLDPLDFPTRASFTATWDGIDTALLDYVRSLTGADLQEMPDGLIETRWEALVHIVNHGTDHRAQVLSMLHSLGAPTFEQDFPNYLRSRRWVSKETALKLIHFHRGQWEQALHSIPPERMLEPVTGDWSAKDLIARLTWYDREMLGMLEARKLSASEWWDLPPEERNRRIIEQQSGRPLEETLEEHNRVYQALIQAIEQLDDEDLNDATRVAGTPPGVKPWMMLEENIWFHYLVHTEAVRAWLGNSNGE